MTTTPVHTENYNGRNIIIKEQQSLNGYYTVSIETQHNDCMWGWELVSDYKLGLQKARDFLDKMEDFKHLEHNVQYCINDDDNAF